MIGTLVLTLALGAPSQDPAPRTIGNIDEVLALEPGPERSHALTELLPLVGAERLQPLLVAAFEEFMHHNRAYRLELSRPLAEAMHSRAEATWSAMSLALVSTRDGDSTRAREVLRQQLARTPEGVETYELRERLGLAILGAGEERLARAPLGSAFARGSSNAGVVLGRLALSHGRLERARALFRSLLDEEPPQSWALRGWGLSMLAPHNPRNPRSSRP